jgi:hypothetical protein
MHSEMQEQNRRDDFTTSTKTILAKSVAYKCSNPACRQSTLSGSINNGVAAHITAAAPGGKRYNPSLTVDQRKHHSNGIWLCKICDGLIDRVPAVFTEELLNQWKSCAENLAFNEVHHPGLYSYYIDKYRERDNIDAFLEKISGPLKVVHFLLRRQYPSLPIRLRDELSQTNRGYFNSWLPTDPFICAKPETKELQQLILTLLAYLDNLTRSWPLDQNSSGEVALKPSPTDYLHLYRNAEDQSKIKELLDCCEQVCIQVDVLRRIRSTI